MKLTRITYALFSLLLIISSCSETKKVEKEKLSRAERIKQRTEYFFHKFKDPQTNELPVDARIQEIQFSKNLKASYDASYDVHEVPAYEWSEVGPADVGGRIRAIAQDFRDANTLLVGGISGGIWKTTDGGNTWEQKLPSGSNLSISSIAQDTISENTWYATSGELGDGGSTRGKFFTNFYLGLGIYKSVDNGETWELMTYSDSGNGTTWTKDSSPDESIPNGLSHPFIITGTVQVANFSGPVVIVTTQYSGIWISDDGGDNFSQFASALTNSENPSYCDILVDKEGVITAWFGPTDSGNNGFYRSYDGGENWTIVNPDGYPAMSESARTVMALSRNNPDQVYAFVYDGSSSDDNEFLVSFDFTNLESGGTYTAVDRTDNLPVFDRSIFGGTENFSTQGGYDMTLAVHPDDPKIVVLGYINLIKSDDGFATSPTSDPAKYWIGGNENPYRQEENLDFENTHHADQHILFFDHFDPSTVWSGHDGGISKTTDITAERVMWSTLNNDLNITQFYTVATSFNNGDSYILGGTQDNGTPIIDHSTFNGSLIDSYIDITSGDGAYAFAAGSFGYTSAQKGAIVFYDLENEYVSRFDNTVGFIEREDLSRYFIHPFTVDPNDEGTIFYATNGDGVIARNDQFDEAYSAGSLDIDAINNGWDDIALDGNYQITALKVTNENPSHKLYFGGLLDGTPVLAAWTNANTDDGSGITGRDLDEVPAGAWLNDIAINPLDGDEIMLVYSNFNIDGLFYSNDGGATLTSIEGNLGDNDSGTSITGPSLRAAEIVQAEDGSKKYFVGTSIGLFSTEQLNGANTNWTLETSLLDNVVVEDLDLRVEDGALAVGTHGRGIFMGIPESNNSAPSFTDQSFDVDENSDNGTAIGTIEATDPDNDDLSFSIVSGNDGQFSLDGSSGNLTVADAEAFDFEATESYALVVEVNDGNGATAQANVTVSINDVNEPPEFDAIDFTVDENVANGTSVGIITAIDPEDDNITFALAQTDDVFDVSSDGEITVIDGSLIDFETNTAFTFDVLASDGELTTEALILVEVNDLDDEALSARENAMRVYPNPTADVIYLMGWQEQVEYQLTNMSGQILQVGSLDPIAESEIDVSGYQPGIYLISVSSKSVKETIRITKK